MGSNQTHKRALKLIGLGWQGIFFLNFLFKAIQLFFLCVCVCERERERERERGVQSDLVPINHLLAWFHNPNKLGYFQVVLSTFGLDLIGS